MPNGDHYNQVRGDSSRHLHGATPASLNLTADSAGTSPSAWHRLNVIRAWIWFELPVIAVTFASIILFAALALSPESTKGVARMLFGQVDPHGEMNVSTWINAGLWQIAGLVAGYCTMQVRDYRKSWAAVTVLCFYFSLDETVRLHEHLNLLLTDFGQRLPVATFVWVIPGALIAMLIAGLLLRMVLSLPQTSRNGLLAGGAVFVLGSLGLEVIEGFIYYGQGNNNIFVALGIVEETLEMTGVALAIAAMLHLIEWRRMDEATAYRVNTRREVGASGRS